MSAAARRLMRAVKVKPNAGGGLDSLVVTNIPRPTLQTGEVLIKVGATAINRGDIAQRKGIYPPPSGATDTLGLEFAGTVIDMEESLEDAPGYVPEMGSRVMGILPGGGYADYCTVPASCCLPVPPNLSIHEAAAIPETYLTAFQAIHHHGGLLPDRAAAAQYGLGLKSRPPADALGRKYRMLVHAGASGVGISACQIAKMFDIETITTSSAGKIATCDKYATFAVSREPSSPGGPCFSDKVEAVVGTNGVDLVLDPVFGGTYLQENAQLLAMDGSIVVLSFLGGSKLGTMSGSTLFSKRATVRFSALRSVSDFYKAGLVASFRRRVLPGFANGQLNPLVSKTVSLEEVAEAHRAVEANELVGKCVVVVDPDMK